MAPITGNLARIELDEGDTLRRGDVIAHIKPLAPALLDPRTRSSAQAQLSAAVASERQTHAQLERAKANVENARAEAARTRALFATQSVTRQQLEQALLQERSAIAEFESLRFAANVADHQVQMARSAIQDFSPAQSKKSRQQFEVPSPVAGRVLKVLQESEGVVQMGTPLLEVGDASALEVVVDILTSDAVRVKAGAAVWLDQWGGDTLKGRVRRVEPSAFTRISALGVEEQRVNVLIDITSPQQSWLSLGDGFRIEAHIVVWQKENVLTVPTSAVFRAKGRWAVYCIEHGEAKLTFISIGEHTSEHTQVLNGLRRGTLIISNPSERVRSGVSVRST